MTNRLILGIACALIATTTTAQPLVRQRLDSLGLRQTYYVQQPALTRYEAASYRYFDGKWNPDKAAWIDNFRGAGGIISTPTDLVAFMYALNPGKLVTKQSLQTMEKLVDGYGMGIFPFDFKGHKGFGHNGKTEGFASAPASSSTLTRITAPSMTSKQNTTCRNSKVKGLEKAMIRTAGGLAQALQ